MPTSYSRRTFITATAAAAIASRLQASADDGTVPVTGQHDAALAPFDRLMTSFLAEHKVPGAALAVTKAGKLVYARGFGYADVDAKEPVEPVSLFRIASVSKPVTAVATLKLAERKRFKLDDKVLDVLNLKPPAKFDVRWKQITVAHCLRHLGGWDRDISGDPIGQAQQIAKTLGVRSPARPADIVRFMMRKPLDFDPGTRFAYSNLGYLVLGRIIEKMSGEGYEAHVRREILQPLGIRAAKLGRARAEHRAAGEVKYYDSQHRTGPSLYPPHKPVPVQYGVDNLEGFEAHGGWIASAVELVKFASAFDDRVHSPLCLPETIDEMWRRPAGAAGFKADGSPKDAYYGCGWNVRPVGATGKANQWHTGLIAGSESLLVRRFDGLNWAVIFNTAWAADGKSTLCGLMDGEIHRAADAVKSWPSIDLFETYLT
jgi:CubicO group peptidase (beta-lactamase class C family)